MLYEGFAYDHRADIVGNYTAAIAEMKRGLGSAAYSARSRRALPASSRQALAQSGLSTSPCPAPRARHQDGGREGADAAVGDGRGDGTEGLLRMGPCGTDRTRRLRGRSRGDGEFRGRRRVASQAISCPGRRAPQAAWGGRLTGSSSRGDPLMSDLAPRVSGYWGDSALPPFSASRAKPISRCSPPPRARSTARSKSCARAHCRSRS